MSTVTPTPPSKAHNCRNCPSFLEPDRVPSKFRKSIGAPVCGRYGRVLGKPGQASDQLDQIGLTIAANCDAYGEPLPPAPTAAEFRVALPDPAMIGSLLAEDDPKKVNCKTCASCEKFVPPSVVSDELGWTTGLCSAKGKLILPDRQTREAKECPLRSFGTARRDTTGIVILPEYNDTFSRTTDPIKAFLSNKNNPIVEPSVWPTDKPVKPNDEAIGIRAWRKIDDPEGTGNFTFLPIYRTDFFSKEDQKLIPKTRSYEHPEDYADHSGAVYAIAVAWEELDETPALWGEPGTGKTELYRHLAWLMNLPFIRISITGSTEVDELVGTKEFDPAQGTYYRYGVLPDAWSKPCVVCLDEPNVGKPDVWHVLRPLIDNSKQMMLMGASKTKEIIERNRSCYMGIACNPAWDPRNIAAEQLGDADVRRLWHLHMPLPPIEVEREIIRTRCAHDGWDIDAERLEQLEKIAKAIRELAKDQQVPISWGVAQTIKCARAMRWFPIATAFRRAVTDYLEPQAADAILDQVRLYS